MKFTHMAAVSGIALCAFLNVSPAFAQASGTPATNGNHVDANGMPTNDSTPAEKAQTADLNAQTGVTTTAQNTNDPAYQAQQQQYQQQQQKYQADVQQNQVAQQDYQDRRAAYESLRDRYRAERMAYHRGVWPDRYVNWRLERPSSSLVGQRVEIINGDRVGTVEEVAHNANRTVEAVLVKLDGGKEVWIDQSDIRYDSAGGILMTNLDRSDLRAMADQRL